MKALLYSLLTFLLLPQSKAQSLLATLDYGTFQGAYSSKFNITYFMKIPFAAPPIGENRFRAPQPPLPLGNVTYDSSQAFDFCPQRTVCHKIGWFEEKKLKSCRSMARKIVYI
jgi:carboxylesterase type B